MSKQIETIIVDTHRNQIFGPYPSKKQAKHVRKIVRRIPDKENNPGESVLLAIKNEVKKFINNGFQFGDISEIKEENKSVKVKREVPKESKLQSLFF